MSLAKILVLCTGNSCRSQMAEGILKSLDRELEVYSAGTDPAPLVHPLAVVAMEEIGIDLSDARPKNVEEFLGRSFDWVVTVCGGARETCPTFTGDVKNRIHIGFDDPADARGTHDEVMGVFRRVRDEIRARFTEFYQTKIKGDRNNE